MFAPLSPTAYHRNEGPFSFVKANAMLNSLRVLVVCLLILGCKQRPEQKAELEKQNVAAKNAHFPIANADLGAEEHQRDPKAVEVDEKWKDAGAELFWCGETLQGTWASRRETTQGLRFPVRLYLFREWKLGMAQTLPSPPEPFGVTLGFLKPKADVPVSEFSNLTNLVSLYLRRANAEDLKTLKYMRELRHLGLPCGSFYPEAGGLYRLPGESLKSLEDLPKLAFLHLSGASDTHVEGIKNLSRIRHLALPNSGASDEAFKLLSNFRHLECLDLTNDNFMGGNSDAALSNLPADLPIKHLYLFGNRMSNNAADAILRWKSLETLLINKNKIGDEGIKKLADLPKLRMLDISETNASGRVLQGVTGFASLSDLTLGKEDLRRGLHEISPTTQLQRLFIIDAALEKEAIDSIARMKHLRTLGLIKTDLSNDTAEPLAALSNLETLNLSKSVRISNSGLEWLQKLPSLKSLHLDDTAVSSSGLSKIQLMPKLTHLGMGGISVTDEEMEPIGRMTQLQWLNLSQSRVSDDGIKKLADLKKLASLDLSYANGKPLSLTVLSRLENLKTLTITGPRWTDDEVDSLRKKLPGCRIITR